MTPTKYNLGGFHASDCTAIDNYFLNYIYAPELIFSLWFIILSVQRYIKSDRAKRKQILFLTLGIAFFLFSFFSAGYLTDYFSNYAIEIYGLFGMVVFMVFLAYLIVKFKAFHIKLIATQALVFGLVLLIGSEFFFIQNTTNTILTLITLGIALGFGYELVRSVKLEVQRKEELENLSIQLSVANDKLHQLDKAKSEFISIASHQLRTPLTSIKGFGSLLLEGTYGEVPEAQRGALEKIYISNERLIQLVEDLLNISRIEAGRMEFDFQEAQIEDLVQEAVQTLELSAKAKNLYLAWKKPAVLMPKLKIDITKIKEVISNMVDNAIKYTQKGGVTVRMEKSTAWDTDHKEHKDSVRVIVSDTGIGMDTEELAMIFEKFQRGKQVAHYHTDGTGLGMFIGRKIVAEHKGRIWAESDGKGLGSRFILELPVG
jgi:signal transduction histidine kinase